MLFTASCLPIPDPWFVEQAAAEAFAGVRMGKRQSVLSQVITAGPVMLPPVVVLAVGWVHNIR
jgi:hypothetical protein